MSVELYQSLKSCMIVLETCPEDEEYPEKQGHSHSKFLDHL